MLRQHNKNILLVPDTPTSMFSGSALKLSIISLISDSYFDVSLLIIEGRLLLSAAKTFNTYC